MNMNSIYKYAVLQVHVYYIQALLYIDPTHTLVCDPAISCRGSVKVIKRPLATTTSLSDHGHKSLHAFSYYMKCSVYLYTLYSAKVLLCIHVHPTFTEWFLMPAEITRYPSHWVPSPITRIYVTETTQLPWWVTTVYVSVVTDTNQQKERWGWAMLHRIVLSMLFG